MLIPMPKRGDRVKLVHKNGDTAEITVTRVNGRPGNSLLSIESASNYFYTDSERGEWTIAEILVPPLPTEPGLYAANDKSKRRYLMLAADGTWHWVDWSLHGSLTPASDHVAKYAATIKAAFVV